MNLRFTNIFGARQSVLIALGLLAGGVSARAATLNVPAQYPTIQAAVNAAAAGDTVLVANGTYTGAGNHDIDFGSKDLTVKSSGGSSACIIDCQQAGRAFYFHSGETTASRVEGFTITNGNKTAQGYVGSDGQGGGVYAAASGQTSGESVSDVIVINCAFTGNTAGMNGGGMCGGTAISCLFTGNTAIGDGPGVFHYAGSGGGMYGGMATNCAFIGNSVDTIQLCRLRRRNVHRHSDELPFRRQYSEWKHVY